MYQIRPLAKADYPTVRRIYQQGIDSRQATFEQLAPAWPRWDQKYLPHLRFVAVDASDEPLAWAALIPVSNREVYRGVTENSIYVAPDQWGRGIGHQLMKHLIDASEHAGVWTIQATMFPENEASRRLHLRHGFRVVGTRYKVAQHYGQWRDTLLMERRSTVVF